MESSLKQLEPANSFEENNVIKSVLKEFSISKDASNEQIIKVLAKKIMQLDFSNFKEKPMSDDEWRELVIKTFATSEYYSGEFICLINYSYMNRYLAIQYVRAAAKKKALDNGFMLVDNLKNDDIDDFFDSCSNMSDEQLIEYNKSPIPSFFASRIEVSTDFKTSAKSMAVSFTKRFEGSSNKLFYNRLNAWAKENEYNLKIVNRGVNAKITFELK